MVKSPVPYMNSKLRKAVYKKRQLHNVLKHKEVLNLGNSIGNKEILLQK
jgi:hypothetical protein